MFNIGDYVVYGSGEICRIEEKTERCFNEFDGFDGISRNEYYKIIPVEYKNSAYYVPVKTAASELRRILNKDEILEIIDSIPQAESIWYNDKNERKVYFESVLKGDDFMSIIGMIKAIYEEREKRADSGKHLIAADERAFTAAEHMLHGEFAFVLGIKENEVGEFIRSRIEKKN